MAIKIGITGGIGSGKSVVSHLLEIMGVPVYVSDDEAKRLTATDMCIRQQLTHLLGERVYEGGVLNKSMLASYLFESSDHAKQVNGIIHPVVKDDFRTWGRLHSAYPVVGLESAILIEAGFADEVDCVVMVYAPEEIRIERTIRRDGTSRDLVEQRLRSQMSDEVKRSKAHFVIVNDGKTALIPQVLELMASLSENIAYLCPSKR